MSFLKYILELVVAYYVIKFILNFVTTLFFVKQVANKANKQAQNFNETTNTQTQNTTTTTFTQPKKTMDIKDGEYIDYQEIKNESGI